MGAGHTHGHSHGTATGTHRNRLLGVLAITVSIMVAEVIGELISGSLALLADAGHMLTDAAGVGLAGGGRVLDQLGECLAGHLDVEHCTFQLEAPGHREHELSHHA